MAETITQNTFLERLKTEKRVANEFQERRHIDFNDNYELYRGKVQINRLTQRQSVNIPLMKETLKTIMAKIDDPPSIRWKELGGDHAKEIVLSTMWEDDYDQNNFEGVDIQDKKTVMLYGRGFKKLNFYDGRFKVNAMDIFDVVVDPKVDPLDLETANFLVNQNIFRSLREVLADPRYDAEAKDKLKTYLSTKEGIIQSDTNKEELQKKQERLKAMGVDDSEFNQFAAGDVILNLTEHYTNFWVPKLKQFVRYVNCYANDREILLSRPLKEMIGVEFYPFVSWGEDIETQDFWSDGPADIVRVPNKVINIWFSQMIENRTLKNFQMHWFDATVEGYTPQTYEPGPGKMLPAPGNPKDTIRPVEVSGLEDTLQQIDFLIKIVERATSATAIEKGVSEKADITFGEVKTLLGQSLEKAVSIAKFYKRSWEEFAMKWYKMNEANASGSRKLYKMSGKGNIWPREVMTNEWVSKKGYKAIAQSTSEQEQEATSGLQKLFFVKQQFPDNLPLARIIQKKAVDLLDLSPAESREVEEFEKKKQEAMMNPQMQPMQPVAQPNPQEDQMMQGIQQKTRELANIGGRI